MINTITGKVPSTARKIRENSQDERVRKKRDHFSSLLGNLDISGNPLNYRGAQDSKNQYNGRESLKR